MNDHDTTLDQFATWEVEAYLDGEEMPHVATFLERHPALLATLRQEQARSRRLQDALYRFDCPPVETLQAYLWDQLASPTQQQLHIHLQQCVRCHAELAALQNFVNEPLPAALPAASAPAQPGLREQWQAWLEQIQVIVATLVTPGGAQLAGVALRSSATAGPHAYLFEAGNTEVSLLVHQQLDGTLRVDGQLFATEPLIEPRYVFTSAQPDLLPITGDISATGTFAVTNLPAGSYQVVIKLPNQAIVVPNFNLA